MSKFGEIDLSPTIVIVKLGDGQLGSDRNYLEGWATNWVG